MLLAFRAGTANPRGMPFMSAQLKRMKTPSCVSISFSTSAHILSSFPESKTVPVDMFELYFSTVRNCFVFEGELQTRYHFANVPDTQIPVVRQPDYEVVVVQHFVLYLVLLVYTNSFL